LIKEIFILYIDCTQTVQKPKYLKWDKQINAVINAVIYRYIDNCGIIKLTKLILTNLYKH